MWYPPDSVREFTDVEKDKRSQASSVFRCTANRAKLDFPNSHPTQEVIYTNWRVKSKHLTPSHTYSLHHSPYVIFFYTTLYHNDMDTKLCNPWWSKRPAATKHKQEAILPNIIVAVGCWHTHDSQTQHGCHGNFAFKWLLWSVIFFW